MYNVKWPRACNVIEVAAELCICPVRQLDKALVLEPDQKLEGGTSWTAAVPETFSRET